MRNAADVEVKDGYGLNVNGGGAWLLGSGVRGLLRCDGAEVVEGIARYVMSQHASLRRGSELMERRRGGWLPPLAALLGAAKRFLEVRPGARDGGAVWVARLGNERRALETLPSLLPELSWTEWEFRHRPDASALFALARGAASNWRRVLKLARLLHRRHEFFKTLRAVELVGYYARYLELFRRGRFPLAVMSSHSNPHGIAFNLAARRCGVPVLLVAHGMPVRPVAPLAYDLAVVHCELARRIYEEEGCPVGRVLVHGRRQLYAPMKEMLPERLSVGLFLCKDVNEGRVRALVERLLRHPRVSRVFVRPHPKNLWLGLGEWAASVNKETTGVASTNERRVGVASPDEPRLSLSRGGPVSRDLKETDVVLAGNSSVLVDAATAGRPSAYVRGIDHGSHDLHSFVARGLVYPLGDDSDFDPDAVLRFYRRADWPDALRLFANVDEDETAVAARLREAVLGLLHKTATR